MTASHSRVRIVTDTTASLPSGYAAEHDIEVVPQIVLFGQESFREEVDLSYAEFVRRLKASSQLPKTAAPQPGDMIDAYRRQLEHADTILSIHPSVLVSGTVRSAETAKKVAFPNADIRILDTRTIAGGLASMVIAASEWVERGLEAAEVLDRLKGLVARGRTYFLVATLENLQRGGRIGGASALIGSVLQIKPILQLKEGRVEPLERIRTYDGALRRLEQLVIDECPRTDEARLCVMHADTPEEAGCLVNDLKAALAVSEIPVYSLGAAITTHAGPGAVGVGFFA